MIWRSWQITHAVELYVEPVAMNIIPLHLKRDGKDASVGCPDNVRTHSSKHTMTKVQLILWKSGSEIIPKET